MNKKLMNRFIEYVKVHTDDFAIPKYWERMVQLNDKEIAVFKLPSSQMDNKHKIDIYSFDNWFGITKRITYFDPSGLTDDQIKQMQGLNK